MDMETADLSPTEWLEIFTLISKEELMLSKNSSNDEVIVSMVNEDDDDDDDEGSNYDDDYDDDEHEHDDDNDNDEHEHDDDDEGSNYDDEDEDKKRKIREAQRDLRMIRVAPLFVSQPRLKKICRDRENGFLNSCFTRYTFNSNENDSITELHDKANDLEYLINLCGTTLTCLDVTKYPISHIMPIINSNCPNLEELYLAFKEIMNQDFENVFSNLSHLTELSIKWQCENSTIPITLAKSLEQIGGTLESLYLSRALKENDIPSPDSLASVFPRLIALNYLDICGLELSQLLIQSIGEMKNLDHLFLMSRRPKNNAMFDTRINMYPIGNLKNLKKLCIDCDYGVRDEFLINLCNNAKKLTTVSITGTNITDIGMSAIDNLEELEDFDLCLTWDGPLSKKNEFITDESIQCLFNQKLDTLNISNCIKITDKGVIKLVENLPNLDTLLIKNTKVTRGAVNKIYELSKRRKKPISVLENIETGN